MSEHPLLAWWKAQLDDIKVVALAAKPGPWRAVVGGDALWVQAYVEPGITVHPDDGEPWGSVRGSRYGPAHRRPTPRGRARRGRG